jgi:hypothetical protein
MMMMKMIFWRNWWNEFGRGNRSTRKKPAPAPLYPPQNLTWRPGLEPRTAAVGSQRLTAWAMARPSASHFLPILYSLQPPWPMSTVRKCLWLAKTVDVNIHVNRMARRLEENIGKFVGWEWRDAEGVHRGASVPGFVKEFFFFDLEEMCVQQLMLYSAESRTIDE